MKKVFKNKKLRHSILIAVMAVFSSSCSNIYKDIGSHDSEEAILFSARDFLAQGKWSEAILQFESLPASTLNDPIIRVDYASAYSGRCGLDFVNLSEKIKDLNPSSNSIMSVFMNLVKTNDAQNLLDCKKAEDILKDISSPVGIAPDARGRFLMAFNSIVKIGVILNFRADTDDDGVVDGGWDLCGGQPLTDMPNVEVNEIFTGFVLFYKNLYGLFANSMLSPIEAVCGVIGGVDPDLDFCSSTDPNTVDPNAITTDQRQMIRALIREGHDGIGLNVGNNNNDIVANGLVCPNI